MSIDTLNSEITKIHDKWGFFKILFFNNYRIEQQHIDMIKNDRKIAVKNKSIEYGDIQTHLITYDKAIRVNREHDEILEDIKNNIFPFDLEIVDDDGKIHNGNYIFANLKKETKRYIREKDRLFSIFEYNHYKEVCDSRNIYDYREQRLMKLYKDLETTDNDLFNSMYEDIVVLGHTLPLPIANKAYMSARRAYKEVKKLALTNSKEFKHFCTFTFAGEDKKEKHLLKNEQRLNGEYDLKFNYISGDNDTRIKALTLTINNFKKKLKKNYDIDLKYIIVPEEHKNTEIHFHALFSAIPDELIYTMPLWLDKDYTKNKQKFGKGLIFWKHGKSDIEDIQFPEKVSTYLAKYMLKNFSETSEEDYEKYANKKRYYPSRNLLKPTEKYLITKTEIDNAYYKIADTTYSETYYNPYNNSDINKYIISNN